MNYGNTNIVSALRPPSKTVCSKPRPLRATARPLFLSCVLCNLVCMTHSLMRGEMPTRTPNPNPSGLPWYADCPTRREHDSAWLDEVEVWANTAYDENTTGLFVFSTRRACGVSARSVSYGLRVASTGNGSRATRNTRTAIAHTHRSLRTRKFGRVWRWVARDTGYSHPSAR